MPGETTWVEAQEFRAPFTNEVAFGDFGNDKENGQIITGAKFTVSGYQEELIVGFLVKNGTITEIPVDYSANKIRYSLDQLLAELWENPKRY